MSNYYCLVAGLPDVAFDGSKSAYTVERFKEDIYPELSADDAACVDLFFLERDNANILAVLRKGEDAVIEQYGRYSREELEEIISSAKNGDAPIKGVPSYIYRFVEYYVADEGNPNVIWEDVLSSYYYDYATKCTNGFVADWFAFNKNVNNILVAFAARKYKMNSADAVIGDGERAGFFVAGDVHAVIFIGGHIALERKYLVFGDCVAGVGNQLADENVFIRIQPLFDDGHDILCMNGNIAFFSHVVCSSWCWFTHILALLYACVN